MNSVAPVFVKVELVGILKGRMIHVIQKWITVLSHSNAQNSVGPASLLSIKKGFRVGVRVIANSEIIALKENVKHLFQ